MFLEDEDEEFNYDEPRLKESGAKEGRFMHRAA
jgi:hypothetical protein